MGRLFGTAGVRGLTNIEITPRLTLDLAAAYGRVLSASAARPPVAVGHDTRHGAEMLARTASSGLASSGCDAHFLGCVPTGVFAQHLTGNGLAGGILITGSHLPPDRIGIIVFLKDGSCAPPSFTDQIEAQLTAAPVPVPAARIGRLFEAHHPFELYVSETVKKIDPRPIQQRRFRILIDPANGAACYVAKELFEWYGCQVELIHFDPNPVPERPSEPRAGTVEAARRAVVERRCDLGLCLDVDADRALFITSDGTPVSEDTVGALFARETLRSGDLCVVPINSSGLIERTCRDIGARLEFCAVGQPRTAEAIRTFSAKYSYEESGKYYFPQLQMWVDGLFSGLKMLDLLTRRKSGLRDEVASLPVFHQVKKTVELPPGTSASVFERVTGHLRTRLTERRTRDITLDGFKRCYDDDAWLLLRPSGTEPLMRVYADAPDLQRAEDLVRRGVEIVHESLPARS